MNIKDYFKSYGINKNGLINGDRVLCTCGTETNISEKKCPKCGNSLSKTNLLNVSKNNLAKKFIYDNKQDYCFFEEKFLLSKDFSLYESSGCKFEIILKEPQTLVKQTNIYNIEVKISNSKQFKIMAKHNEFIEFMDKNYPGFIDYCEKCLKDLEYSYAKANFNSLSESEIANFLNVWINYNSLKQYFIGYKVYHYGSNINLALYYPDVDFNNLKPNQIDLDLDLLRTWDLKNVKYIEKIIEFSKDKTLCEKLLKIYRSVYYSKKENTLDIFNMLYNSQINVDDFIRLYESNQNEFIKLNQYQKCYKKIYKKINWSDIKNLNDFTKLAIIYNLERNTKLSLKECINFVEEIKNNPLSFLDANLEKESAY